MKLLKITIISMIFFISTFAQADIHDRINQCESRGGGSCIYALLRELAGGTQPLKPESKCKCSTKDWSPGSPCNSVSDFEYLLRRDGNLVKKGCARTKDKAYVACVLESNKNSACK